MRGYGASLEALKLVNSGMGAVVGNRMYGLRTKIWTLTAWKSKVFDKGKLPVQGLWDTAS